MISSNRVDDQALAPHRDLSVVRVAKFLEHGIYPSLGKCRVSVGVALKLNALRDLVDPPG